MELIYYPNPLLMKTTRPITRDEPDLDAKIERMIEIMYGNDGIGLAGPQVGWNSRLFIIDLQGNGSDGIHVFRNPRILSSSGTATEAEGCLSFPGLYVKVKRNRDVVVEYEDQNFDTCQMSCNGLMARAVQHEHDHLENILLVHRMSHTDKIKNRHLLDGLKERHSSSGKSD